MKCDNSVGFPKSGHIFHSDDDEADVVVVEGMAMGPKSATSSVHIWNTARTLADQDLMRVYEMECFLKFLKLL